MDIITRLKFYMDSLGIPSSQFADSCRIPRPTFSQMLNGRNKKISDEIISKIHEAYPGLSIMWLMFGEGEMGAKSNIEISTPQNVGNSGDYGRQSAANQLQNVPGEERNFVGNMTPNNSPSLFGDQNAQYGGRKVEFTDNSEAELKTNDSIRTFTVNNDARKIKSILVFYDDNSFESFVPSN